MKVAFTLPCGVMATFSLLCGVMATFSLPRLLCGVKVAFSLPREQPDPRHARALSFCAQNATSDGDICT